MTACASLTGDPRLGTVGNVDSPSRRLAAILLATGTACGPVQYLTTVTRDASSEVAAAKSAGADKYAPYEWTAANEYLHKAREEEGYADHQAAVHFGRMAFDLAKSAREIALAQAASGAPAPAAPPPDSERENPLQKAPPK